MKRRQVYWLGIAAAVALLSLENAAAQVQKSAKIQPVPAKQQIQLKIDGLDDVKNIIVVVDANGQFQFKLQQPPPAVPAPPVLLKKSGATETAQAKELAARIDALIEKKLTALKLKAAPLASDTQFFRRLHLDLAGRIPSLLASRDFLDDESPDERATWTEMLLESEQYAVHFSHVWAAVMLSNRVEPNQMGQRLSFERWLQDRLKENQGYDLTAKEIVNLVRKPGEIGSPNGFNVFHGNKPEEQSGAVARLFLGVKIECAQCHPHPFASWTKQQFWEFAAFFDPKGVKPAGNGQFKRPTIPMPGKDKIVSGKYLDGSEPPENMDASPKTTLGNWITRRDNPYFAKAAADNVWSYFFGVSLLEPLLEKEKDKNPLTHPELLSLLATELANHHFDLKYLVRAIVYTKAYQRTTQTAGKDEDQLALFGRMPVRALSADQLFDSLMVATNSKTPDSMSNIMYANPNQFNQASTERTRFLLKFYDTAKATESTTSILQALYLMNNKFLSDRVDPKNNSVLHFLAATPGTKRQLETLFLIALSRQPTTQEVQQLSAFLETGGTNSNRAQALSDVLWALLNSSEFALNH